MVQQVPHLEGRQVQELVGGVVVVLQVQAEKEMKDEIENNSNLISFKETKLQRN